MSRIPLAHLIGAAVIISCCHPARSFEPDAAELRRLPSTDLGSTLCEGALHRDRHIVRAQYETSAHEGHGNSFPLTSQPSLHHDAYNAPAANQINNNFIDFSDFAGGIVVVGENVALKIGGYVKADVIKDFDAIDSTDTFDTTTISTSGPSRENSRMHGRQSRLSLDARWRNAGDVVRTLVEGDFFGGDPDSSSFRLRHAYGNVGRFTAGQTWTTFTDASAVPQTLDVEGGVSNVNLRQALVRWDQPLWNDGVSLALALEDPRVTVEAPSLVMGEGRTELPDFITRLRLAPDWGEYQAAFVLRTLGYQPDNEPAIRGSGWGFNFTGSFLVVESTKAYYQVTFGDGIGSYRGIPDVVATGPETAAILGSFGWMVGVHHQWTDSVTSNFTFSELSIDDVVGQDPDNLSSTTYLAVNLIVNPLERVFCGVEYLYGIREDVGGASGTANRVQLSFGFFLP